jgi:hypothetical protein
LTGWSLSDVPELLEADDGVDGTCGARVNAYQLIYAVEPAPTGESSWVLNLFKALRSSCSSPHRLLLLLKIFLHSILVSIVLFVTIPGSTNLDMHRLSHFLTATSLMAFPISFPI